MGNGNRILTAGMILVSLAAFSGTAAAAGTDDKNLNDYTCKDVMRFSGEHREVAVALLHGYFMGKAGTTSFNSDTLASRTDKFIDHCLDNPTAKAIDSMAKASK